MVPDGWLGAVEIQEKEKDEKYFFLFCYTQSFGRLQDISSSFNAAWHSSTAWHELTTIFGLFKREYILKKKVKYKIKLLKKHGSKLYILG